MPNDRWPCCCAEKSTFPSFKPHFTKTDTRARPYINYIRGQRFHIGPPSHSIVLLCCDGRARAVFRPAGRPSPFLISLLPIDVVVFVLVSLVVPFWQHYTRMLRHGVDGACSRQSNTRRDEERREDAATNRSKKMDEACLGSGSSTNRREDDSSLFCHWECFHEKYLQCF